jgi:hypothetical protein
MGHGFVSFDPNSGVVFFVQTLPEAISVGGSVQRLEHDKPAGAAIGVIFYEAGRLKAQHSIDELLERPWLVSTVPFRVQWITYMKVRKQRLVIETTSLRHVELDLATGGIARAEDLPKWVNCPALVYGTMRTDTRGVFIEKAAVIKSDPALSAGGRIDVASRTAGGKPAAGRRGENDLFCLRVERDRPAQLIEQFDSTHFEHLPFNAIDR